MSSSFALAPRAGRACATDPTDALTADAGVFARDVARIWLRPHAPYFDAEPARRRAIQLIAARERTTPAESLAGPLATMSLRRLVAEYLPHAPAGFAEALKKLSGAPWRPDEYQRLQDVLRFGGDGGKTLRHAPEITTGLVAVLAALPSALRRPRIVAQLPSIALAQLVARGAKRVATRDGEADADLPLRALADRLERARSTPGLFRMLIEEIGIETLAPPPIPGATWLAPIASAPSIESAARRFENCLRCRIPWMLAGRAAYYEVLGEEPAIVEIVRDATGLWVVGEVRGHANVDITPALWARVRAHLEAHGARTRGARPDQLGLALAQAAGW